MIKFAFYGRVSTEDQQDPESSRGWQLTRSRALIESRGGVIVAEFFDVDKSRSIPWQRRPQATALLAELKNPGREFDAVVIGEPHRAFYGNQYGLTFPIFDHYGVPLWVPEVGGPIDPANEAHDLVMSVFGGMSKGERNRVKIRVRTAMASQAQIEGRFLGGRPPYGYLIVDAGPHPNPAKAADGKRMHKLALDPVAAPVVMRIFAEFLAGAGHLRHRRRPDQGRHPQPVRARPGAQHPPVRHRLGQGRRPRDPHQPALHRLPGVEPPAHRRSPARRRERRARPHRQACDGTRRTNGSSPSRSPTRRSSARKTSTLAQATLAGRGSKTQHKQHRRPRPYALRGVMLCGLCGRRMSGKWNNDQAYYRCRFPAEYALANRVSHPKNVYLREADVLGQVDDWLAELFAPANLDATLDVLAGQAAQLEDPAAGPSRSRPGAHRRVRRPDQPLPREPGRRGRPRRDRPVDRRDPGQEGDRPSRDPHSDRPAPDEPRRHRGHRRRARRPRADGPGCRPRRQGRDIRPAQADLTYQPDQRLVEATAETGANMRKGLVSEGGLEPPRRCCITETVIYHQPKLPRQGPPGPASRRRTAAAPPWPHDRSGHLTCGNDDRGQPEWSCRPGPDGGIRTAALRHLAGIVTASRRCPEFPSAAVTPANQPR